MLGHNVSREILALSRVYEDAAKKEGRMLRTFDFYLSAEYNTMDNLIENLSNPVDKIIYSVGAVAVDIIQFMSGGHFLYYIIDKLDKELDKAEATSEAKWEELNKHLKDNDISLTDI